MTACSTLYLSRVEALKGMVLEERVYVEDMMKDCRIVYFRRAVEIGAMNVT